MAIIQYTQINNRSGLQRDLPQLSTAELGWSIDSRRLFIGNGTLEEGAPEIGDTEILTEYSDIFSLAGAYTYKGTQSGYTVGSSPTFASAVWSAGATNITVLSNTGIAVGQLVIGPGLATNTFVTAVSGLTITISESTLVDSNSYTSIAFIGGMIITYGIWDIDHGSSLRISNPTGISPGMDITGINIPSNTQITSLTSGPTITQTANLVIGQDNFVVSNSTGILVGSLVTSSVSNIIPGGTIVTSINDTTISISGNIIGNATSNVEFTYTSATVNQTLGVSPGAPVQIVISTATTDRTLQEKLDDTVSVRDFGAVGDGITDDTAAINAALNQLYCVAPYNTAEPSAPLVRRILLFPAGRYIVSSSLLIPPNCILSGEGLDHTVVEMVDNQVGYGTWSNTDTISVSPISNGSPDVQNLSVGMYVDGAGITAGSYIVDIDTAAGTITLNTSQTTTETNQELVFSTPADYVARTASSLQETGAAIDTTSGINPQNILIRDMSFSNPRTTYANDVFLVERSNNVRFERVGFKGNGTTGDGTAGVSLNQSTQDYSLVYPTKNIEFDACRFSGITYGILSNANSRNISDVYATQCISITNGTFATLNRGIYSKTDDYSWIIVNNTMDDIVQEGIKFSSTNTLTFAASGQMITTGHNIFLNVGNSGGATPSAHVIYFYNRNCLSVGDMFARNDFDAATYSRVYLNTQTSIAFQGTQSISLGQRILNTSVTSPLSANTISAVPVPTTDYFTGNITYTPLTIDTANVPSTTINYGIKINDGPNIYTRSGILNIAGGPVYSNISGITTWNISSGDDYTENYDSGFQLIVYNDISSNRVAIIGYDNTVANSSVGHGTGTMQFYIDQIVDTN